MSKFRSMILLCILFVSILLSFGVTAAQEGSGHEPITVDNVTQVAGLVSFDADAKIAVVAFSPEGQLIAYGLSNGLIKLWDVASGEDINVLEGHTNFVTSIAFSPDGRSLASASESTVLLWDIETTQNIGTLEHDEFVSDIALSFDGAMIASASGDQVHLWDVQTKTETQVLEGHEESVLSVSFSPDGITLASASYDGTVRLWDVQSGSEQAVLQGTGPLANLTFNADGSALASVHFDGCFQAWETQTNTELAVPKCAPTLVVNDVAFSSDGTAAATGAGDGTIRLWNIQTGEELALLRGHTGGVLGLTFSPDGSLLASVSNDSTLRLWAVDAPGFPELSGGTLTGKLEILGEIWTNQGVRLVYSDTGQILETRTDDQGMFTFEFASPGTASLKLDVFVTIPGSNATCTVPGFSISHGFSLGGTTNQGTQVMIVQMYLSSDPPIEIEAGDQIAQDIILDCD